MSRALLHEALKILSLVFVALAVGGVFSSAIAAEVVPDEGPLHSSPTLELPLPAPTPLLGGESPGEVTGAPPLPEPAPAPIAPRDVPAPEPNYAAWAVGVFIALAALLVGLRFARRGSAEDVPDHMPPKIIVPSSMEKYSWSGNIRRNALIIVLGLVVLTVAGYFVTPGLLRRGEISVSGIERAPDFAGIVKAVTENEVTVEGSAPASGGSDAGPIVETRIFPLTPETQYFLRYPKQNNPFLLYERQTSLSKLVVGSGVVVYAKAFPNDSSPGVHLPTAIGVRIVTDRVSILEARSPMTNP